MAAKPLTEVMTRTISPTFEDLPSDNFVTVNGDNSAITFRMRNIAVLNTLIQAEKTCVYKRELFRRNQLTFHPVYYITNFPIDIQLVQEGFLINP